MYIKYIYKTTLKLSNFIIIERFTILIAVIYFKILYY